MRRMRRGVIAPLAVVSVVAWLALPLVPSAAAPGHAGRGKGPDTFEPAADVHAKITKDQSAVVSSNADHAPVVGDVRTWLGLDDEEGFYPKSYELRGVGDHIEVWTATGTATFAGITSTDLNFADDDCRNGERTTITQEQVDYLIGQFDSNILPIESEKFSVAPDRDGRKAPAAKAFHLSSNYYRGEGDNVVVLVDNVRDDNFKDTNNVNNFSYIAGFFSSGLNGFFNRNVMTIDGFDWLHRTGANPPDGSVPGDNCASAPARPFLYEGVFAHEYNHLLRSYVDPAETTWQNEGTADTAIVLTGYSNPKAPITDIHFDSHIQCFQGFLGVQSPANPNPREGGPENSLNVWGDQDFDHESEILCDYGAAYSYLLWLADTYGDDILTTLHNDGANQGFDAVQAVLDDVAPGVTVQDTIDAWLATMALDAQIDGGASLTGGDAALYQVDRLEASINWDTSDAFDTPGAPPNGGDFVRLRDGAGTYLSADQITSISFDGATDLPPLPITWEVDATPPPGADGPALYSTNADGRNDVIVQNVDVPAGSSQLTFDAAWDLETTFDFGYAQVTTDGGETYTSLACTDAVDDNAGDNVGPGFGPGFNGFNDAPSFAPQTCDLTPYAGTTVGLAFRYFSDSNTHGDGFWVDNVAVGGNLVSDGSTLDGWQSATEYNPVEVEGYSVQLISYGGGEAHIFSLPIDGNFHGELTDATAITDAIGPDADVVSAIVTFRDGTELVTQYAPYTLTVNGTPQPGGE
jgi:Immune inhibitor A-like, MAM domain